MRETVVVSVEQEGVTIRRVGFRSGTDAELRMLHAVEAPVEAERRPDREPQPVESYIAFARKLPSTFDDHTWVAQDADGTPVASAACWSSAAGDPRIMECDVYVRRDRRRERLGSKLLEQICDTTLEEGRTILVGSTFDAVPAGEAFARSVGARVARVNRTSELRLAGVDWAMVEEWIKRAAGTRWATRSISSTGRTPRRGVVTERASTTSCRRRRGTNSTSATSPSPSTTSRSWTPRSWRPDGSGGRSSSVTGTDAASAGRRSPSSPGSPRPCSQQNTGIDPEHRGLGLAKWCKAAMLQRIRLERAAVKRVRTGNAFSNAPMLAINDALGFEVISMRTEWQAEARAVRRLLTGR